MGARKIFVQGGTVVGPEGRAPLDVLVEGEKILALGVPGFLNRPGTEDAAGEGDVVDAKGCYVLPGLVDPHLHFNSPFMGTTTVHGYGQGTLAAAFGGITTIIDFSTQPKGGSILDNLRQKEEEARESCIDWSLSGILLDAGPETLAEIPRLVEAGMPTYKCFTTYKHSGRLMDDEGVLKLLEATARYGGMLMVHAEADAIIEYRLRKELAAGHFDPIYHARTRPVSAETVAIRRMLDLVREVPAPLYIVHTSAAGSLELIREAREEGLPVHAETCTHYLALTEDKLTGPEGQLFICSPPLRKEEDLAALWRAVASGTLEVVSSDDAGVPPEDNLRIGEGRFDRVPSGMSGIEPRLAVLYSEGVAKNRITLERLVELTSAGPARLFGLYPQKGCIAPGADADLVIYDPEPEWTMSAGNLHMNTSFCPFEGFSIKGRVRTVLLRTGIVLGPDGGALKQMLLPFKLGLGGPIGRGQHWMSWIHIRDHSRLILAALESDAFRGALNAVAPNPVRNKDFTRSLGRALHRPTLFPAPPPMLKLVFGGAAEVLTASQRCSAAKALAAGATFEHSDLDHALAHLFSR